MEGVRQGRHHHLGVPADRLPQRRPRQPRVRAPRLPPGRRLLVVHLLPHPGPLPLRPRRSGRAVPRRESRPRRRPGGRLGLDRAGPRGDPALQAGPRQGRPGAHHLGRGARDRRRRPGAHHREVRAGPGGRLLADPGDEHGQPRRRRPLHQPDRRHHAVVLRLVRRPADRQPTGLRRPDRRARVGGLVERRLPDDVGLERAGHPHPGRPLHDRGALQGNEGRHRQPGLRRQHQVRRRVAAGPSRHRRRAGDGDGPRGAHRVLRPAPGAVLRRLRDALHRRPVPGDPDRARRVLPARPLPDRRRPGAVRPGAVRPVPRQRLGGRARRRGGGLQDRGLGRRRRWPGTTPGLVGVPAHRLRRRTVEPGPGRHRAAAEPLGRRRRHHRPDRGCPGRAAPLRHRHRRRAERRRGRRRAAPRGAGAAGGRAPGDHRLRPAAGPVRRRPPRAAGGLAHRLRRRPALHPGLAGGHHLGTGRDR